MDGLPIARLVDNVPGGSSVFFRTLIMQNEPKVNQMHHHDPLDEGMTNGSVSPMGMHS